MRLVTLSPSRPASGLSLTEKVMVIVGGSIGWAGIASVTDGSTIVSATVALDRPANATISPACASSTGTRSRPRKARILVMRPFFHQRAVARQRLDGHVGLDRPGLDAAGQQLAQIGIGLKDHVQHRERLAGIDGRRRYMLDDQVEQTAPRSFFSSSIDSTAQPWRPEANRVGKSSCSSLASRAANRSNTWSCTTCG